MKSLITKTSNYMAFIASMALVFLMVITFVDVVGRFFFNAPLTFAVEVIELGMGILVFFGMAITTLRGGHITVDLLSTAVSAPFRRALTMLSSITAILFFGVVTWRLFDRADNFMDDGLFTQLLSIPVYPVVFAMCFAAGVSTLVAVYIVLHPTQSNTES